MYIYMYINKYVYIFPLNPNPPKPNGPRGNVHRSCTRWALEIRLCRVGVQRANGSKGEGFGFQGARLGV